ncbi:MAG: cytochrome c [Planctomycetes bacterium]|nr:cytochrome c [Planctomycetota bacterium]
MLVLVSCFLIQSSLVYFDESDSEPLSDAAREGRRIWHRHNCQSCHQFYGFGGFLGPDLTNATQRLTPERLEHLLTVGSEQMPSFNLSSDEIEAFSAFLAAMNDTGRGQARFAGEDPALRLLQAIEQELAVSDDANAIEGFNLFMSRGCQGCHIQFGQASTTAPDLIDVGDRLIYSEIMEVLENGRLPGMPAPSLSSQGRELTYEFLMWLGEHRAVLRATAAEPTPSDGVTWPEVPWWEFR